MANEFIIYSFMPIKLYLMTTISIIYDGQLQIIYDVKENSKQDKYDGFQSF